MNGFNSQITSLHTVFQPAPPPAGKARRGAPRHQANLYSSILMTAVKTPAPGIEEFFVMHGRLIDASISGLGIAIRHSDLREMQRFGRDPLLTLVVPLPRRPIRLEVTPAKCRHLSDTHVLLGTKISNIGERERVIFTAFIDQCHSTGLYQRSLPL